MQRRRLPSKNVTVVRYIGQKVDRHQSATPTCSTQSGSTGHPHLHPKPSSTSSSYLSIPPLMGCAQSRIDNEESVTRCKDRRNHMKDAVSARNAFAAAHTAYSVSLKSTGAALSDFSVEESFPTFSSTAITSTAAAHHPPPPPPPPLPPHIDTLPPPPPPLPSFSPSPLNRSSTMPPDITASPATPAERGGLNNLDRRGIEKSPMAIDEDGGEEEEQEVKLQNLRRPRRPRKSGAVTPPPPPMPESKGTAWDYFFMVENMTGSGMGGDAEIENEDDVDDNDDANDIEIMNNARDDGKMKIRFDDNDGVNIEFKTPEKKVVVGEDEEDLRVEESAKEEVDGGAKVVTAAAMGQNMAKVMGRIDDHFLKASESAQEVTRMLEATRMHYHSNFADDRGMVF